MKKILTPFSSLILTNFSPDLAPVQGRQGGPQNIYQAGENSLMIVLEECLGATGACAKDFQPAYKGFPTCLQFIYSFIKKTFGEYPGIIETEDTFGSDLTELEFHPSLLHRIWCCLRPLVLRTYLRSCPIMLHRHHFFSYR